MKRKYGIMSLFLVLVLCVNVAAVKINPNDVNLEEIPSDGRLSVTSEPEMPEISQRLRSVGQSTLETAERAQWVESVIRVQEAEYNQEVLSVEEDETYIRFIFEQNEVVIPDEVMDANNVQYTEPQIATVEYLKPEAQQSTLGTTAAMQTKIITYWGWSGYIIQETQTGIFNRIKSVLMLFVPDVGKTVSWVIGQVVDSLDEAKYVTAQTRCKFYYRNRAGAVYDNGHWYPTAYVGEQRCFGGCWASYTKPGGEVVDDLKAQVNPKEANDTTFPTNYDSRQEKPHYNDSAWIMQKALDTYYSGGYWDAYGVAANQE